MDWSNSVGLDLHLRLDPDDLRCSLERELRASIRDGRLPAGTRLPSSRVLAADLGIARGTVTQAYDQLTIEGYLAARQGSGTLVARMPALVTALTPDSTAGSAAAAPPAVRVGAEPAMPAWDLTPGTPTLSTFPRAAWLAATRRVLAQMPDDALGYGDPRGRPELRAALSAYLGRARGVFAPPARIVVCSGYGHALWLLLTVLADRRVRRITVEDPSSLLHRRIAGRAGLSCQGALVDHDGVDIGAIETGVVLVTPAHQYPLGVTLAADRRTALAEWACQVDGLVIEDDYDGEFRYDRQPVGALQGLAPDRVVYAGTASKTLAPGLRLSWLVVPDDLVEPITELKVLSEFHPGVVDQLVLADLIARGGYDRHIRQCRQRYRLRRNRLVQVLADSAPHVRVSGVAAGMHALVELGSSGQSEAEVIHRAAARSLRVRGLAEHWLTEPAPLRGLVVGYATPPDHAFAGALEVLAGVL
jgi:GntR family transcriptional regulator/MocR family aminotransferase